MKKLLLVFVVLLIFQAVAVASPKQIDLREYQQATGTINVLAAPFEEDDFYLATFNFDEQMLGNKVNFYQGTCLVGGQDGQVLHPLSVKKITGNEENINEAILNKQQDMPYMQDFRTVQTNSEEPKIYTGGDATNIVYLGKFQVITSIGTFDDCIGIKIYNQETGEGMIQYLAKGCGVVYMEGVQSDGSKVEIARLTEIRPLNEDQIKEFKTKYFI